MKKRFLILGGFIAIGLIIACSSLVRNGEPAAVIDFPTATNHFLFRGNSSVGTPDPPASSTGVPTISGVFLIHPTGTPFPEVTPGSIQELVESQIIPSQYYTITVYQDGLNPNWDLQNDTGMFFAPNVTDKVFHGQSSISFTPLADDARLFFTVSAKSQEAYPRDRVVELSFQLYSGDEPLSLDQLFITVVGSNSQPFWSADDHSVKVADQQPVFSETGLDELGFNTAIPAHTWVPVEIDLDKDLIFDPDYKYVTGFYLKTGAGFSRTLMVDDISLLMLGSADESTASVGGPAAVPTPTPDQRKEVIVQINTGQAVHPISELIYGVSGAPAEILQVLRPTLNSWGGNPNTRYLRDFFYRNGSYDVASGFAGDAFISQALEAGAEVRLTLPTLGWVAKNVDQNACSFIPGVECSDANGPTCLKPGPILVDPTKANVPIYRSTITSWVKHLVREKSFKIRILAMDNEPELWGFTHYDVHSRCTTYDEILNQYLSYATAVHDIAPEAELAGPVTSSWYYYWNSAAGEMDKARHTNRDFLPWFLDQVRHHDIKENTRSLHVLDLHYFPEGVYNDKVDEQTATLRLRSTRSLWDEDYVDESWINESVYLIPRMKTLIEVHYPGTKLGLSEWNWGAEGTMNGALAIADVLGIFGREDLYYAAYWQYPPLDSPGFYAFKMYTNFNDRGSRFGDTSVSALSSDLDTLSSYAALSSASGDLHIMLVNKQVVAETLAKIYLGGFTPDKSATIYRYDASHPEGITETTIDVAAGDLSITLPPYSITLLVFHSKS